MPRNIYLDDAATSAVRPSVIKAMLPFFSSKYGNPSSAHYFGEEALKEINSARIKIAKEINAKPEEIIFTSGTTESNNLALQGLSRASKRRKIIVSSIEHASIIEICSFLEEKGYRIVKVPVDNEGLIDLDFLRREVDHDTLVVSIMHVNNVLGTIQDFKEIGNICKSKGVLLHTDAAQSFGKIKIDVREMNLSLLSASCHKIGGPKGIGFLYLRDGVRIEPLIFGGGQERGLRGGTENVPAIVGLSRAIDEMRKINKNKILKLRNLMMDRLQSIGGIINGSKEQRIYNNIHVSFPGVDASTLVAFLSHGGIYVSTGSACESKREREDHVLTAIGLKDKNIRGSIRITLNEDIREKDVNYVVLKIGKILINHKGI